MHNVRPILLLAALTLTAAPHAHAQASTIPSAQSTPDDTAAHAHKLLDQMLTALGGDAWLHRNYWKIEGRAGSFYKGQPTLGVFGFEEYYRLQPFAERLVVVTHSAPLAILGLPGADKKDEAIVWTPDNGYEITYKGNKPLPAKDVADYQRRRAHTLDVVLREWLHQPGVLVTFDGTDVVNRRLVDKLTVLTAANDAVTLTLDAATHLPMGLSYQYRDPQFQDIDTDSEQYDNYQMVQGIATPYTITRLHNGEAVTQRFVEKIHYEDHMDNDLFNPDRPIQKKAK